MILLKGKEPADILLQKVAEDVSKLSGRKPKLVCVLSTDNPASHFYVNRKVEACKKVGIISEVIAHSPKDEHEFLELVRKLNQDDTVDGILVQLPLPDHIDSKKVIETIDPKKDVDGFHPINVGKTLLGDDSGFFPCTPLGIAHLLDYYNIEVTGKHVVILGRSTIVGKPLAALLLQNAPGKNATVTVCHSKSNNLQEIAKSADILIAAIGKPEFVDATMVKKGAVVIDVGVNKVPDSSRKSGYRVVGDVQFETVSQVVSALSPVPGGVGPMTIAMLVQNTMKSFKSL